MCDVAIGIGKQVQSPLNESCLNTQGGLRYEINSQQASANEQQQTIRGQGLDAAAKREWAVLGVAGVC